MKTFKMPSTITFPLIALSFLLSFLMPSSWVSAQNPSLSDKDRKILSKLSQANSEEVQLGKMAQKQASHSEVKKFGQRMSDDHSQMNTQIHQIVSKSGITLPKTSQPSEHTETIKAMSSYSGKEFDRHYIETMLQEHRKDIAELQQYADTTTNPEMKSFMKSTLPILENHIRIAENVAGQIGISPEKGLNHPEHPTT
jgi:putative membrane protein